MPKIPKSTQLRGLHRFFSTHQPQQLQIKNLPGAHNGILELGLSRPSAKNSFSKSLLKSLQDAIQDIKTNNNVRVVVLRSLVPGIFSAGADLKERATLSEGEVVEFVSQLRQTFQQFADIPPPTIAAIDGVALGGGLELALACDIRVAAETAKLGLVETKLGIIPGAGGTQRLPRLVGPSVAKELIFTGRVLNGREAHALGLVDHVVRAEGAYGKAVEIAEAIVQNGPVAVRVAKKVVNRGLDGGVREGLRVEEQGYGEIVPTKDRLEGLAAFREKRKPFYKGE